MTGTAALDKTFSNHSSEALERIDCPLCASSDSQVLMQGRDRLFGLPGQYPVVRCNDCGMQYLNPRPTFEALGQHYPDDYFPVRLPHTLPPLMRKLSRLLLTMRWIKFIRRVEGVIGRIEKETKVVDVGCGLNEFLVRLDRVRGCRGLGVDFKPEIVAYIRDELRLPVVQGALEDAKLASGSVDLVTMNEYLEHEPEPRRVLSEARRISKRGAHLIIEVPYCSGVPARLFGSRWSQLDVPRHLAFYTPETLADMLSRSGYRLIHVQPFGAPFSIAFSVMQTLGFTTLGRLRPRDVLLMALTGTLLFPLYPFLREFMFTVARAE